MHSMQLMKPSNLVKLLIVALLLLPMACPERLPPAGAAPVSLLTRDFNPADDSYVYENSPNTNFGDYMIYVRSKDGANVRAFIQFDLDNIPPGSKITEARLYLYKYGAPDVTRTYRCSRVTSSWGENSITWNNQPAVESPTSDNTIGTSVGWESWVVTSSVQQFRARDTAIALRNYGWRIADTSEGSLVQHQSVFYSKEIDDPADRPYLRVKYYPPHLELETYGSGFTAGNWVKMTVHRRDYDDNTVTRGDLKVELDSTSTSSNSKFSLTQGGTAITELVIPDGSSSKDFWYYEDKAGTWTIHVYTSDYVYLAGSPPLMIIVSNYGDDSEQQDVVPGPINSFVLGTVSSPQTAGVSFTIIITAKDAFGNTVTTYTGTNALSDTTGTINPTMSGAFVNGVWSGDVVINKVANNVKVSTSGGGKTGESNAFNVGAGPPAKLLITPPTLTVAAGVQYSSLTITLKDAHDFEATTTTSLTVNLATTSPDGEFREVGTANKITSVTIPSGAGSALVDYYDIRGPGPWTLSASAVGLTSGTSIVNVIPDTTPPVTTISVGLPKYQAGTTLYVGGSTGIELSATDDASGVKSTKYRIDGGPWNAYAGNFTLTSYPDGSHTMGYYSSDKAGNNESEKTLVVILDKRAPLIETTEPSGTIIQKTRSIMFRITVEETGSGVASVEIIIDGASEGSMTMGDDAYTKTKEMTPGAHTWSARTGDNVDNQAITPDIGFVLTIDDQPPTISNVVMTPSSPSWGEPIRITATIDDALSSIQGATIYYSTNGGSSWNSIDMLAPMPPATTYEGTIPTQMPMTRVRFYINASDILGNAAISATQEFVVEIPIWLYGAVGAIVVVSIIVVAARRRKPSLPSPPPPPPS